MRFYCQMLWKIFKFIQIKFWFCRIIKPSIRNRIKNQLISFQIPSIIETHRRPCWPIYETKSTGLQYPNLCIGKSLPIIDFIISKESLLEQNSWAEFRWKTENQMLHRILNTPKNIHRIHYMRNTQKLPRNTRKYWQLRSLLHFFKVLLEIVDQKCFWF